jgi:hypothetical protein
MLTFSIVFMVSIFSARAYCGAGVALLAATGWRGRDRLRRHFVIDKFWFFVSLLLNESLYEVMLEARAGHLAHCCHHVDALHKRISQLGQK